MNHTKRKPESMFDPDVRPELVAHLHSLGFVGIVPNLYHDRLHVLIDEDGGVMVFPDWEDGKTFEPKTPDQQIRVYIMARMTLVQQRLAEFHLLCEGVLRGIRDIGVVVDGFRHKIPKPKEKRNSVLFQQRQWKSQWALRVRMKALDGWEPIYLSSEFLGEINMELCDVVHTEIQSVEHAMNIITNQDRDDCDDEMLRDIQFNSNFIFTRDNPQEFTQFFFKYGLISCEERVVQATLVSPDTIANELYDNQRKTLTYHAIKLRRAIDKADREMIQELKGRTEQ
uniref:Uncharacterized protein n=1 Tax=Pseudomonas phage HRDY3 TaxID=3236930 RepID=A0AB39CDL0_9VIRU